MVFFRLALFVLLALLVLIGAVLVAVRFADGPVGPIPGGALTKGPLVTDADIDWNGVLGGQSVATIEFQLVEPVGSRSVGAFAHEGELYVPCDLGFVWRRMPDTSTRTLLRLIWVFKRWHEDALKDGRVVIRVDGKRYARQAVLVTDETLKTAFRQKVLAGAEEFFGGLMPIETDPKDIWFFRLDARSKEQA